MSYENLENTFQSFSRENENKHSNFVKDLSSRGA